MRTGSAAIEERDKQWDDQAENQYGAAIIGDVNFP
jgi:hypothetical protein